LVLALFGVAVAWLLLVEHSLLVDAVREHVVVLGAFALAMVVGELFRVQMPSGRVAAPVATATAIALAMLGPVNGHATLDVPAGVVAVVVAMALGVGLVLRRAAGRP